MTRHPVLMPRVDEFTFEEKVDALRRELVLLRQYSGPKGHKALQARVVEIEEAIKRHTRAAQPHDAECRA